MKNQERDKAIVLRVKEQLGYGTIAKQVSVSKGTLSRWLKDYPLSKKRVLELRRQAWSRGEAKRELFRETMRKKREEKDQRAFKSAKKRLGKLSKQSLFIAGLMLYAAEGDKKDRYHIGLANTDPSLINFFIWWLVNYLSVHRNQIRVQLHLYESMSIERERDFWIKSTGLKKTQFYKDQVRKLKPGSFSYPESFRHGTCKLYVFGVDKTMELLLSMKAFLDTYNQSRS